MTYLRNLDLGALLEVLGEGLDEVLGRDIPDGDAVVRVDDGEFDLQRVSRF